MNYYDEILWLFYFKEEINKKVIIIWLQPPIINFKIQNFSK